MSNPELEELDETTREILNNPDTMEQIRQSGKEIEEGKTKVVKGIQDLLDEIDEE